jgi:predicted DNA-binding transcriptional regulator AlpA
MNTQEPLSPAEAAKLLRISQDKLQKMRSAGTGPEYVRLGHRTVLYERGAVLAWLLRGLGHSKNTLSVKAQA